MMDDLDNKLSKIQDYLSSFIADTSILNKCGNRSISSGKEFNGKPKEQVDRRTQPKNKEEFHKRVLSFKFGSWTNAKISPLFCSRYGWKLSDTEMLQCVTCQALLSTSLPPLYKHEAYATFLERLEKRIITSHRDWCGWSYNPSPEEFLHPPLAFSVHYLENLINDVKTLSVVGTNLPFINIRDILSKLNMEEWQFSIFFKAQKTLDEEQLTAAILVLLGWCFEKKQHLKCSVCLRNIGLWNFLPLNKKHDYLRLKERDEDKQKRKAIKEEVRRQKEIARKAKEERKRKREEEKRMIREEEQRRKMEEVKIEEERKAKQEAKLKEIESMNYDRLIEEHMDDESNMEEIQEEEESMLLNEDDISTSFFKNNESNMIHSEYSKESQNENISAKSQDNDLNNDKIESDNDTKSPLLEIRESSDDSNSKSNNDDLWLEAVGCEKNETDTNSSSSDAYDRHGHCSDSDKSEESKVINQIDIDQSETKNDSQNIDHLETRNDSQNIDQSQTSNFTDSQEISQLQTNTHKRKRSLETETDSSDEEPSAKRNFVEMSQEESNQGIIEKTNESLQSNNEKNNPNSDDNDEVEKTNDIEDEHTNNIQDNIINQSQDENINDDQIEKIEKTNVGEHTDDSESIDKITAIESNTDDSESIDKITAIESNTDNSESIDKITAIESIEKTHGEEVQNSAEMYNNSEVDMMNVSEANKMEDGEDESSDSEVEEIEEESEEPDTEDDYLYKQMVECLFDPFGEHRPWCGWLTKYSSSEGETKEDFNGYLILPSKLKNLLPESPSGSLLSSKKYAQNIEGLREIRSALYNWELDQSLE